MAKVKVGHENDDLHLEVKLKECIADPSRRYIVIASTGGKWFIPIPVYLWPEIKKEIQKMLRKNKRGPGPCE